MTELLTASQMRAIEAAAIASGEVTGLELMERAGRGVVEAVLAEWPELALTSHRAVVLCGPGNNGGDGFVVARVLKERGWEVEVFLYGDEAKLPADAGVCCERWKGVGEARGHDAVALVNLVGDQSADLIVDAIFGIGLSRPVEGDESEALDIARGYKRPSPFQRIVAVDVPSVLCSESGRCLQLVPSERVEFVPSQFKSKFPFSTSADLTVTFHAMKSGHVLAQGPDYCRKTAVADIGLHPRKTIEKEKARRRYSISPDRLSVVEVGDSAKAFLDKGWNLSEHKFDHGHALILSGGSGHGGAARLAARGALRIGAGLVTLGVVPEALAENAARVDAVMLMQVGDAAALAEVLKDDRINALCIGPGLGVERAKAMLPVALGMPSPPTPLSQAGEGRRAVVIDADGLTALAGEADLFGSLHEGCVLTPHAGEFARVFPDIAAKLDAPATSGPAYSKVDATREAAKRAGCVVLFKGADTVIAAPDGRCAINSAHYERSAPWLATAGSGDVLAGFITGLLARGFGPMQAAETAAWLHVECAIKFGPGLIAEDLPEMLPGVLRDLGV